MSQLMHLIYASRATFAPSREFTGIEPNVARILAQSRRNNPRRGLGGVLYYGDGSFFQCLEGEPAQVTEVFEKIKTDPRHTGVRILAEYPVEKRLFDQWSMKYVAVEREVDELLREHGMKRFDPFSFDAHLVRRMLELLGGAMDPTGANDLSIYLSNGSPPAATRPARIRWLPVALGAAALLIASLALMIALDLI